MITKLNEFKEQETLEFGLLVEMAKINKDEIPYDVYVNGGDSYGTGRNEHGKPHFHFADNMKNYSKFKLSVLIPTIEEWKNNKTLIISPKDSSQSNWNGLNKEKNILIDWMSKNNSRNPRNSNLFVIINFWNTLNSNNNNVKQVPNIGEDLF